MAFHPQGKQLTGIPLVQFWALRSGHESTISTSPTSSCFDLTENRWTWWTCKSKKNKLYISGAAWRWYTKKYHWWTYCTKKIKLQCIINLKRNQPLSGFLNHPPKKNISYSMYGFFSHLCAIGPSPRTRSGGPFRLSFSKWLDAQGAQLWVVPSARPGPTSFRFVSQALGDHGINGSQTLESYHSQFRLKIQGF